MKIKIGEIINKYREQLLYLFFGGLTFLVSVLSFAALISFAHLNELIANVISWILAVLFAFFTNRIWVFQSPTKGCHEFIKQMGSFFGGRVVTLLIEELILLVFISTLHFPSMVVKIIAQVIVIVLNYVISKLFVFRTKKEE